MYAVLKSIIIYIISISILTSCSMITNAGIEKKSAVNSNENNIVIDVGNGKSGGNISFRVNISEGFKTKANVSGWNSVYNSVVSYKIALVTSAGTGSNTLTSLPNGNSSDIYTIITSEMTGNKTSPTTQIFLTNVPAGTYWIAVSAYDAQNRNVTKVTTTTGTISDENFAVSTGGGDGLGSPNNGRVTVASDFSVPASAVTIPLTLTDSFGADVQANVTITDGALKVKSNIALIRFYLVNSKTTSNLVDANIIKGPFDLTTGTKLTDLKAGTSTTITFKSIPSGTYYVAVAAYESSSTVNSTTNITNLSANTFANITITTAPSPTGNMGTFSISNSEGDGGDSPGPGRVVIDSNYNISTASAVVLALKLKD